MGIKLVEEIVVYPSVNAVILDSQGRVLITRRSPKVREPGKWCLPGGHLDPGETWEQAAIREVQEETGLLASAPRLFGLYSDPALSITDKPIAAGHRAQFVCAAFLVRLFEGEVVPNDEVDLWDWVQPTALPAPILRSHPVRVQDALAFRGEVFLR